MSKTQVRNHKISVSQGMSGFYAVHTAEFNDGKGWYRDIITTGIGRYKNRNEAVEEAREWAAADEIELEV